MKENERAAFEKAEKLTTELEKSPLLKKLREDEAAETLKKRKAAADRIEDLRLDLEATGVIQKEIDDLVLKLAEFDADREKMKTAINEKVYFLAREKNGIGGEIRHEQEILYGCFDPAIDEAVQYFRDKLDELRKPGKIFRNSLGAERNIYTLTKKIREETNEAAILAAMRYCQDAISKLEEMKLVPALDTKKIESLKTGIPRIDVYTENENEKPMDKGPNPSFLAKIRQELDNKVDTLLRRPTRQ